MMKDQHALRKITLNTKESHKTEDLWQIAAKLQPYEVRGGIWTTTQWQLTGFELNPSQNAHNICQLQLYRDERTDYRFNLSSQQPKLFLVMDHPECDAPPVIQTVTASQTVAARYMDGDNLVLSNNMPFAVQAWIEAFIGRHGELLELKRKKYKGAGRSHDNKFF